MVGSTLPHPAAHRGRMEESQTASRRKQVHLPYDHSLSQGFLGRIACRDPRGHVHGNSKSFRTSTYRLTSYRLYLPSSPKHTRHQRVEDLPRNLAHSSPVPPQYKELVLRRRNARGQKRSGRNIKRRVGRLRGLRMADRRKRMGNPTVTSKPCRKLRETPDVDANH